MGRIIRRTLAPAVGVGMALLVPTVASAEPPQTTTETGHRTETFMDVAPSCDEGGDILEITIDYNFVEHETVSSKGVHATFTNTGTFVAVGPNGVGRGHFTQWGNFNENPGGAVNGTFTFNIHGRLADGSRLSLHVTDHFNVTPTGAENFFTLCKA